MLNPTEKTNLAHNFLEKISDGLVLYGVLRS
jgi:hypothetical protein